MATLIETEALNILSDSRVEDSKLYLPDVQLSRVMYVQVNKILVAMGGKWNRKEKAHVFANDPEDAIENILLTGEYTDIKKEFQFFETPKQVVDEILQIANIGDSETVLEPSAGRGGIAQYLNKCDCIELEDSNYEFLISNGYNIVGRNFLEFEKEYDVIVANPPFSKQQDIDHIKHMIKLAKRKVVSVASSSVLFRDNKKTVEFRELVEELGGYIQLLPPDSFKSSGTKVNTCLISIEKGE